MLAAWGDLGGWRNRMFLFSQDQFSGLRLAQQVMLTFMFNQHPSLFAKQHFAVYLALRARRGERRSVFYVLCCRSVKHTRHVRYENDNKNDYHQDQVLHQELFRKIVSGSILPEGRRTHLRWSRCVGANGAVLSKAPFS